MAALKEEVKEFIVTRLAQFGRPQEIADEVKAQFQVDLRRQRVEEYDPEKQCKTRKWVELHAAVRKGFLDQKAGLAIAHRSWRLLELEDMARLAKKQKNYRLAKDLLEQAAKEEGGFYVNAKTGAGAGDMTEEERIALMRAQMAEMRARTLGEDMATPAPVGPALVKSPAEATRSA